eukprot:4936028-Pleurochrysis_carterae.AAC.4
MSRMRSKPAIASQFTQSCMHDIKLSIDSVSRCRPIALRTFALAVRFASMWRSMDTLKRNAGVSEHFLASYSYSFSVAMSSSCGRFCRVQKFRLQFGGLHPDGIS